MSVPADQLMKVMASQQGGVKTPPAPPAAASPGPMTDAQTPPMASPMTTPEPALGSREAALINVSIALDLLEQALASLDAGSKEGEKVTDAMSSLTAALGGKRSKSAELQPSEILQMVQSLPSTGGGASPEMKALMASSVPGMPPRQPQPATM